MCVVVLLVVSRVSCCLACVIYCCIDVSADRNGSADTQTN